MNLILDGLYEQHMSHLEPVGAEQTIVNFAEENTDSTRDLYTITNIIKTSSVCGYTYEQCYEEIRKKLSPMIMPDSIIAAMVRIIYDAKNKRNIYKEAAAHKYQVPEDAVTDEMVEKIKNTKFDSYTVDEDPATSWDDYYYNICKQVARNSKCLSRRIGAILVRDKRIIASGYNGPAAGIPRCDARWHIDERFKEKYDCLADKEGICPRRVLGFKSGEGLELCVAVHAEENSILMCAKEGISAENTTMYMTCGVPCKECLNKIIQVGVKELVVTKLDTYHDASLYLLENSNVKIRLFDFID